MAGASEVHRRIEGSQQRGSQAVGGLAWQVRRRTQADGLLACNFFQVDTIFFSRLDVASVRGLG
jgi:hypothetical protein